MNLTSRERSLFRQLVEFAKMLDHSLEEALGDSSSIFCSSNEHRFHQDSFLASKWRSSVGIHQVSPRQSFRN